VSADLIPVLWLCGPAGVGKTAIGWEIYTQLADSGIETGYVDIDQLGMCYPEPPADPGRHWLKLRNLGAVVANYKASGARCVVVSGIVDAPHRLHADLIPGAVLTACRLRVGRDELRRRFLGRGESADVVEEVLAEADAMDATDFADVCVDTSGLSIAEVTQLVRERIRGWPGPVGASRTEESAPDEPAPEEGAAATADGSILLVCGPTGVGKSTVGFQVYVRTVRAGLTAAYIDLDQIGFCRPAPADDCGNHKVKARNLASMWRAFRDLGAQCLIAVGPIENAAVARSYVAALPAASVTLCRLHADDTELTRRIMLRGQGGGSWPQPGDPLAGQPTAHLRQIAESAVTAASVLDRALIDTPRLDTTTLTVGEAADATWLFGWRG
jgi:adenylylsulfate kinase-like enzyme